LKHLKGKDHIGDCHRWKDNIKMYLKEIGTKDMKRTHLVQESVQGWDLMKTMKNLLVS
jgi:hypothetical protein